MDLDVNKDWFEAVDAGNEVEVRKMMDAGMDVNVRDEEEESSALMHAVMMHHKHVVEMLLTSGVLPNAGDNWETLHWAVRDNNVEMVKLLLSHGANPNTADADYNQATPMTRAAYVGSAQVLKLLIDAGGEVNKKGLLGNTPLNVVLKEGHVNGSITLLLQNGADPTLLNEGRETAVEIAGRENRIPLSVLQEIFEKFQQVESNLHQDDDQKTSFTKSVFTKTVVRAMQNRQEDKLVWLIENMPQCINEDSQKLIFKNLLHQTCMKRPSIETVQYLVSKASIESVQELLSQDYIIETKCLKTLKIFISAATNPTKTSPHDDWGIGGKKLSSIFKEQCDEIAMLHIQANTVKNMQQRYSHQTWNVFTLAVMYGKIDIAKALVANGCNTQGERNNLQMFVSQSRAKSDQLNSWLQELMWNPLSLRNICRIRMRRYLGLHVIHKYMKLPLPTVLKNFIMLKEFPHACHDL